MDYIGINCLVLSRALDKQIGGCMESGMGHELSLYGLTYFLKYGQDPTTMPSKWHSL